MLNLPPPFWRASLENPFVAELWLSTEPHTRLCSERRSIRTISFTASRENPVAVEPFPEKVLVEPLEERICWWDVARGLFLLYYTIYLLTLDVLFLVGSLCYSRQSLILRKMCHIGWNLEHFPTFHLTKHLQLGIRHGCSNQPLLPLVDRGMKSEVTKRNSQQKHLRAGEDFSVAWDDPKTDARLLEESLV